MAYLIEDKVTPANQIKNYPAFSFSLPHFSMAYIFSHPIAPTVSFCNLCSGLNDFLRGLNTISNGYTFISPDQGNRHFTPEMP